MKWRQLCIIQLNEKINVIGNISMEWSCTFAQTSIILRSISRAASPTSDGTWTIYTRKLIIVDNTFELCRRVKLHQYTGYLNVLYSSAIVYSQYQKFLLRNMNCTNDIRNLRYRTAYFEISVHFMTILRLPVLFNLFVCGYYLYWLPTYSPNKVNDAGTD